MNTKSAKKKPVLLVVLGATASGKTAWAIQLAQHFGSEIISCDARQFYKEMNIGTAVPSTQELAAVPHHFIQHISIHQPYNAGMYERDALALIAILHQKNPVQIMVGGSGMYIKAVCEGLDNLPPANEKLRTELTHLWKTEGIAMLQANMRTLDASYYAQMENQNPHRLIRALEIMLTHGKNPAHFQTGLSQERPFEIMYVGIDMPREHLYRRINLRVEQMMENGLVDEARNLFPFKHLKSLQTVGYQELFAYFEGQCSLEEATALIQQNTRRYAKRQLTWFRKNEKIHWFSHENLAKSLQEIADKVSNAAQH
ncbi:MAG: tRNA (adenosine(37)-N6)-dimethylallyltransferase MiaA [Bacteroidetes bacterium]|nr:tRNA (adenosine(37)-N6)-dimethylallyltransferase MiaA [Bacteroidota bacterium]MCB9044409.1 tRNA (adenosine(37)-N6)-dimethylallyltransferase MiaA [Chitinophagales bacterium]